MFRPLGLLPALKPLAEHFYSQPYNSQRASATPNPQATPAATDLKKGACFNCGEPGHFADTCPNPCLTPQINEIGQEHLDAKTLGDNKATEEDNATDKSEN